MSTIFPGMDPYLEEPRVWHGFHNRLIVYLADQLQQRLRPRYIVAVEDRVFVQGPEAREVIPDAWIRRNRPDPASGTTAVLEMDIPVEVRVPEIEIHESYLEILDRQSGQQVVTVVEVLSPTNKYAGPGRDLYLTKQREVRASQAHLIEIDLLRNGPHSLAVPGWAVLERGPYAYLVCVNRAIAPRDAYQLYPSRLRERLPKIRVPLAEGDADVPLDLQAVIAQTYEAGCYRDRLRYDQPCVPPLMAEEQAWAFEQIQKAGRVDA